MASVRNTAALVGLLLFCIGGLVATSVVESSIIFNGSSARMFIPSMIFPYEEVVMVSLYGVVVLYMILIMFLL